MIFHEKEEEGGIDRQEHKNTCILDLLGFLATSLSDCEVGQEVGLQCYSRRG